MAAARLYHLKDEFGPRLHLDARAYPLVPNESPARRLTPPSAQGRTRAAEEALAEGLEFRPWPEGAPGPASSLPALEAAKCARSQGEEQFRAYDLATFKAFFEECRDVSDQAVLVDLAERTGLDVDRFTKDLAGGVNRPLVMSEFVQCLKELGPYAQGIPLVSFNSGPPLTGCAPMEVYRRAVLRQLEPLSH